jgi:dTDP-4-amino-4,6-dideoxygalactose transaminase
MDPKALRECITEDTVAVVPVHYAGVACEMDEITAIANEYDAAVVEDAAQALNSTYDDEQLGTIGDIGCFSLHGTKSYVAGEGGAIFLNDESYVKRAERIRQKGTNYEEFKRNEVDRYQWVDIGSSYVPSELQTALAYTQLTRMDEISSKQEYIFEKYTDALHNLEIAGLIELPSIPSYCSPNYHMYPLLTQKEKQRDELVSKLQAEGVGAASHYEPLHTSPYGRQYGYEEGDLPITESVSNRLLRIPIHTGMDDSDIETVIRVIEKFYN